MLEVGGIFEVAEGRHAVALGTILCRRRPHRDRRQRSGAENERIAARQIAAIGHLRVPVFAAFSASHHHTVGNAAEP